MSSPSKDKLSTETEVKDTGPKLVPALVRGVQVLDIIAKSKKNLKVTDIAAQLEMAKSTAHGICVTFCELNLLVKKSDQTYQLGPHVMRWSNRFMHETDVAAEFASMWDEGSELPGATITLSVLEGPEVVYLAARNAELSVGYDFRIGMRLPAVFTATGKSFLSHKSDFEIRRLVGETFPDALTEHSVDGIEELLLELKEVRARGYAVDNQQVKEGMVCYGASVMNSLNKPIAGVAVSLSCDAIEKIGESVIVGSIKQISEKISFRLGAEM